MNEEPMDEDKKAYFASLNSWTDSACVNPAHMRVTTMSEIMETFDKVRHKVRFARAMLQQIRWTVAVTMEAVEQLPDSPQKTHIRKQLGHILWMIGSPLEEA